VSGWTDVFLGVIALATLATAIMQIGVLLAAGRLARRIERFVDHADQELRPIMGHLNAIGRDASRAASLATAQVERADRVITTQVERADRVITTQVERVDRVLATLVDRLGEALDTLQNAVARPAREGAAVLAGLRAALDILRERGGRQRSRADDEKALFI
jgi:hypothetical protein